MTEGRREPSSASPSSHRAAPRDAGEPNAVEGRGERSGPLLVERHRKADGRSLILYRDVAESGELRG